MLYAGYVPWNKGFYQKYIFERLGILIEKRKNAVYKLPRWIEMNEEYLILFLRGLFESEGSLSIHLPTST